MVFLFIAKRLTKNQILYFDNFSGKLFISVRSRFLEKNNVLQEVNAYIWQYSDLPFIKILLFCMMYGDFHKHMQF